MLHEGLSMQRKYQFIKEKQNRMKTKKRGLIIGSVITAIAIIGTSFALWATTLKGNGGISASGSWNVEITNADLNVSSKGAVIDNPAEYTLLRTNKKTDGYIVENIRSLTRTDDWSLIGTQIPDTIKGSGLSSLAHMYFVDTTKFDVNAISGTAITSDIVKDETTIDIHKHLNKYYLFYSPDTSKEKEQEAASKVIDGFLKDSLSLIKDMHPDTYQNYALVHLRAKRTMVDKENYTIAVMQKIEGSDAPATHTAAEVNYADVAFSLPGAWAQYSVTVTNKGSVDANLENAVIRLDTENEDQLSLDAPDLTGKTLAPGESCTIQVVVKALDNGTGSLNASGRLVVELPYAQDTVEPAPSASYTK